MDNDKKRIPVRSGIFDRKALEQFVRCFVVCLFLINGGDWNIVGLPSVALGCNQTVKAPQEDWGGSVSRQHGADSIWPFLQMLPELSEHMNETPFMARLVLKAWFLSVGLACGLKLLEGSGEMFSPLKMTSAFPFLLFLCRRPPGCSSRGMQTPELTPQTWTVNLCPLAAGLSENLFQGCQGIASTHVSGSSDVDQRLPARGPY